jgi:hypothetical protein
MASLLEAFGGVKELAAGARGPSFLQQHEMSATVGCRVLAVAELIRRYCGPRTGTKAESLALAYLSTAADTIDALGEEPSPELLRQAAFLMRNWRAFAERVL